MAELTKNRNYGIDLLRMLAMFMVVTLHVLGKGGILSNAAPGSGSYAAAWFPEICAYCAVNCYALISGYVGVGGSFKYRRMLPMWLQVFFYSFLFTLLFAIFAPSYVGEGQLVKSAFPALTKQYWYFTAYFCMFFFVPFMNKLLLSLEKAQLRALAITIAAVFSLMTLAAGKDVFLLGGGYCALWLGLLYLMGGCARLLEWRPKKELALCGYALCVLITWAEKVFLSGRLTSYVSPTMLLAAICLLLLFAQLDIKSEKGRGLIEKFAPAAFGVYLIHTQPCLLKATLKNSLAGLADANGFLIILAVLGIAAAIYLICSLIELLRIKLFEILKVKQLADALAEKTGGKVHGR